MAAASVKRPRVVAALASGISSKNLLPCFLTSQPAHQEHQGVVVLNLLHGRLSGQRALEDSVLVQLLKGNSTAEATAAQREQKTATAAISSGWMAGSKRSMQCNEAAVVSNLESATSSTQQ